MCLGLLTAHSGTSQAQPQPVSPPAPMPLPAPLPPVPPRSEAPPGPLAPTPSPVGIPIGPGPVGPGPTVTESANAPGLDAMTPPTPPAVPLAKLTLFGKFLPSDSSESLGRFLDVRVPGSWDEQSQARVQRDLDALGYRAAFEVVPIASGRTATGGGSELRIEVQPMRVVRRINASGNWPIFAWEVLSYMSWHAGYRLPEGPALVAEIRKQEADLRTFLNRKGYYDATATINLDWAPESPEQVNVHVRVRLNVGFFRLRYNIGNINTEGFKLMTPAQIGSFFDHCCLWLGRTSTERIQEDSKRLLDYYKSKGYVGMRFVKYDIQPDRKRKQIDLTLAIDERKRVVLKFTGRKAIAEKELLKDGIVTIFRDNYASNNELDESARNIFRYYQTQGFFDAKVTWRWIDRAANPMRVEFLIHEGPQLKVRELEFVPAPGAPQLSFTQAKLAEQITVRRYPRLGLIGLGEGGFASAVQLEQDVKRLEEFYRRAGYPSPKVTVEVGRSQAALDSLPLLGLETALGASPNDADLFIRFRINEGRSESIDSVDVTFVGPHTQSEAKVRKILALKPGTAFTPELLTAAAVRLFDLFRSVGHPYADIDATSSKWNPEHTRIAIRWVIDEREEVRFGPIMIRGNFYTHESVIRRELPFRTGDLFDYGKLLIATQNLNGRLLFTSVRVVPNPGETPDFQIEARQKHWTLRRNPVPILVEVVERWDNTGEVGIFVGFSTDNPVYSTASYNWRNVGGRGAELELRGELGVRVQSLLLRLGQRLGSGNKLLRLDVSGYWRNDYTYSVGLVNSYGANAELTRFFADTDEQGRLLQPNLRLFTRLEFNFSQILVPLLRAEGTTPISADGDRAQALKLSFGIVWDRRVGLEAPGQRLRNLPVSPNPLMPIDGFLLSARVTGALCCSFTPSNFKIGGSFIAFLVQAMFLKPFGPELRVSDGWQYGMRRFWAMWNLRINYGIPLSSGGSLPVVERYYAGGDTATRGYDTDALRSEEVRAPASSLAGDVAYRVQPLGGNVRILSSIEWEFAITPKLLSWPWVGALFIDTGAVFDGWEKLRWNDVRFSVGISLLRLLTQFGKLSLDYAYPLTLPGQDPLLQSERWKHEAWYQHFPGRIHFNWGLPIAL